MEGSGREAQEKVEEKKSIYDEFLSSVQFSSVAQSCPTLFDPMNPSTPGSLSITIKHVI